MISRISLAIATINYHNENTLCVNFNQTKSCNTFLHQYHNDKDKCPYFKMNTNYLATVSKKITGHSVDFLTSTVAFATLMRINIHTQYDMQSACIKCVLSITVEEWFGFFPQSWSQHHRRHKWFMALCLSDTNSSAAKETTRFFQFRRKIFSIFCLHTRLFLGHAYTSGRDRREIFCPSSQDQLRSFNFFHRLIMNRINILYVWVRWDGWKSSSSREMLLCVACMIRAFRLAIFVSHAEKYNITHTNVSLHFLYYDSLTDNYITEGGSMFNSILFRRILTWPTTAWETLLLDSKQRESNSIELVNGILVSFISSICLLIQISNFQLFNFSKNDGLDFEENEKIWSHTDKYVD